MFIDDINCLQIYEVHLFIANQNNSFLIQHNEDYFMQSNLITGFHSRMNLLLYPIPCIISILFIQFASMLSSDNPWGLDWNGGNMGYY